MMLTTTSTPALRIPTSATSAHSAVTALNDANAACAQLPVSTSRYTVKIENAISTNGNTTNVIGAVVRSRTFGVRANAIFLPVTAWLSERNEPDRLTGSRIRLKP